MKITIIAALDKQNAIGYKNDLLTYIAADLKRFKALTTGHTIIMGRKTFDSLPNGALPNRKNIVLSGDSYYDAPGAHVVTNINEALKLCSDTDSVFVIGGASVYKAFLPLATNLCLTFIHHHFENTDTFFPEIDFSKWTETDRTDIDDDPKSNYKYSFVNYQLKQ